MADTSVKVNPRDQLGGSMEMEYIEELFGGTIDLILKGPQGSLVNEGPVTGASLEQRFQMPELKPDRFSSGTIEFNKRPDLDPQLAIAEAQRIVQESQQARSEFIVREELRFEVAGMSDEELAVQGDYKNTSFKNRLSLRSIANRMWILMKRAASVLTAKKQEKPSFFGTHRGRINYFMQQNMAGERAGGQHVMSAVG